MPAILAITVAAILANHGSALAITEWGADQDRATLTARDFPTDRTPGQATRQRLFDPPADRRTRPLADRRPVATLDYGHGRILERRVLVP